MMSTTLGNLRYALRGLKRSPLFASVAILSLALGIGANTAIFTLIDQILLRKLRFNLLNNWSWSTSGPATWAATWATG